ncbi:MAG: AAA family ATPase [Planctomycetia bacterium]|nr:AAA family ATPase [Planctomycetia bacterium]
MTVSNSDLRLALSRKLADGVLTPLKNCFIDKDEIIDLLGVALVAGENLFLLGPPGTAKSAVVQELARRIEGLVFDYLLTRFTEPNELFGPFDIRKLRDGELVTNTEGMLPEAELVFLDELLNANSAILNSLLMVLNERRFRRGRETRKLPVLMVVGASNRLPEDDALAALFDRFLLRVRCDNVATEQLQNVLVAGWQFESRIDPPQPGMTVSEIAELQRLLREVDLSAVRGPLGELVQRLRHAGISVSDRRAVKLQRAIGASALLCGRMHAQPSDLWVVRHIWDTEEQVEVLRSLVHDALERGEGANKSASHPRARGAAGPDPESLARDLDRMSTRLNDGQLPDHERSFLRDQLGVLSSRCAWVPDHQQRSFLESKVADLWTRVGGKT